MNIDINIMNSGISNAEVERHRSLAHAKFSQLWDDVSSGTYAKDKDTIEFSNSTGWVDYPNRISWGWRFLHGS